MSARFAAAVLVRLGFVACGVVFLPATAHAYIDPGSGSFIFQVLVAAALAAGASLRVARHQARQWLSKVFRPNRDASTEDE